MTTDARDFEAALGKVRDEYQCDILAIYEGEMNSVAIVSPPSGATMVLKVPHFDQDTEHRALDFLTKATDKHPCPLLLPRIIERSTAPPFLLIRYIPGEVLPEQGALRTPERETIGRNIAHFALWETQLNVRIFKAFVDNPRGDSWRNWDTWFDERIGQLANRKLLPTLTNITREMTALRRRHYPKSFDSYASQVIHGDLRLPNLVLRNTDNGRKLTGIIDFGTMRRGDMAEELRSLHPLGDPAIKACNEELVAAGHPAVSPEKIRFWCVGRWTASLLYQIANNRPDPAEYQAMVDNLTKEYPDADWSELQ